MTVAKKLYKSRYLLLMILPCVLYYVVFRYAPMWGILISFQNYNPFVGLFKSAWVGLKWFKQFFGTPDALSVIKNTFLLGLYSLLWEFPIPIFFALILNEVKNKFAKSFVQTVTYMPHFLSLVVVCGMVSQILSPIDGAVNQAIVALGGKQINFTVSSNWFRTVFITSDIWQETGFGAIIYLAALSGIDPSIYESAEVDGASKFKQMIKITLPMLTPTIMIMLLLRVGGIMEVGFEKVFLLYNPAVYSTADVISTYVYRAGITGSAYSYASAIGLFNSLVSLVLLMSTNFLSKRLSDTSLW